MTKFNFGVIDSPMTKLWNILDIFIMYLKSNVMWLSMLLFSEKHKQNFSRTYLKKQSSKKSKTEQKKAQTPK